MWLSLPISQIALSCWETVYIVFVSTFLSVVLGLTLGLVLFYTRRSKAPPQSLTHWVLGAITNIIRSVPFIILLFALVPLTRWLLGTSIGNNAVIIPLAIGAIPFYARIAESAFFEVPSDLLETADAMGATRYQTITKFLIPEALPSLIKGGTLTCIALISYSAMAGIVGGGGLGELAYDYGFEQNMLDITLTTIVLLVILVQLLQSFGDYLAATRKLWPLTTLTFILAIASITYQIWPSQTYKNELTVGIMSGVQQKIFKVAQRVALQQYHFHLKIRTFSDYNTPNAALNSGDIDANVFQHLPFLENQIQKNGYALKPIAKTFVYPFGFYSRKIHSLKALPDGATVAIPNDPSNEGRALRLLQKAHLITLKPGTGLTGTVYDIQSNPLHLHIVPMAAAQIPHAIPDVTLAGLTNDFITLAGFQADQALLKEGRNSPYGNIIVARKNDANPLLSKFIQVMHSPSVVKATLKIFPHGAAIPAWKRDKPLHTIAMS